MKFVTVRDFRTSPAAIWKQLPEEGELVITNNGKPIALLTPVSDQNLEESLKSIRAARAASAVRTMQQLSARNGNAALTAEDIASEIESTRTSH
tara:strand:+ start:179 stop:460 length:282 start_codon:yes stop_codon:yes gene_type:complete